MTSKDKSLKQPIFTHFYEKQEKNPVLEGYLP